MKLLIAALAIGLFPLAASAGHEDRYDYDSHRRYEYRSDAHRHDYRQYQRCDSNRSPDYGYRRHDYDRGHYQYHREHHQHHDHHRQHHHHHHHSHR